MPAILTLTVIVVLVLVIALFVRDAKRAQQRHAGTQDQQPDVVSHHEPPPVPNIPRAPEPPQLPAEELAQHVRGLRHAVDEGLIGHDEAVASIIRQAGGGIGEEAAARLLASEGRGAGGPNGDETGGAPGGS